MFPNLMRMRTMKMTLMLLSPTFKLLWKEGVPMGPMGPMVPMGTMISWQFLVWQTVYVILGKNVLFTYIKTQPNLLINLNFQICFFRPKKFTLKGFKRHYFVLKDLSLSAYRCQDDAHDQMKPRFIVNLKGCEVTPDVNISQHRYGIKLAVPSADGMSDLWLKCDNVSSIAIKWTIWQIPQFFIQLVYKLHFGTWILLFGPGRLGSSGQ